MSRSPPAAPRAPTGSLAWSGAHRHRAPRSWPLRCSTPTRRRRAGAGGPGHREAGLCCQPGKWPERHPACGHQVGGGGVEHGPGGRSGADLGEGVLRGGERRPGQRLETGIGTRPRSCRGTVGCPAGAQAQRNAAELLILRRYRKAHLEEQRGLRSRVPGCRPTSLPSANPCRSCREPWACAGQHPVAVLPAEPTQPAGN